MGLRSDRGQLERVATWDVAVVGSGYGAGVLAARLSAGGKLKVCILERGREFESGGFPKSVWGVKGEFQVDTEGGQHGNRLGLFDLHANPELSVLVGCGLGGTSLINANVMIKPSQQVFEDAAWPTTMRGPSSGSLGPYYDRAETMLRPSKLPGESLPKLKLLEDTARACGAECVHADINVTFVATEGDPATGVPAQRECVRCGNCVTGCNYTSKNTLCYTYLPIAKRNGAAIFTECEARWLERVGDEWLVHYRRLTRGGPAGGDGKPLQIRARAVVLGAGALGSTGILLRSNKRGLATSPVLGTRFSGNGDSLAFGYDFPREVDSVGFGRRRRAQHLVGPSITGIVDLRDPKKPLAEQIIIEDGAFPGSLQPLLRYAVELAAVFNDDPAKVPFGPWFGKRWRELLDLLGMDPLDGTLNHSQIYLVIGHDGAAGTLSLDDNESVRLSWPRLDELPVFGLGDTWTAKLSHSLGGDHVHNPLYKSRIVKNLITVHPLGGCALGNDADHGVVNELGQVFDGNGGVYKRLFVADGSIVPTSVGVNPLWTITALAERIADAARTELGIGPSTLTDSGSARTQPRG